MAVVMKTKHWLVKEYKDGFGVFAVEGFNDLKACYVCALEAMGGSLEAVLAIEMCEVDEMLKTAWNLQLKEQDKCKPRA